MTLRCVASMSSMAFFELEVPRLLTFDEPNNETYQYMMEFYDEVGDDVRAIIHGRWIRFTLSDPLGRYASLSSPTSIGIRGDGHPVFTAGRGMVLSAWDQYEIDDDDHTLLNRSLLTFRPSIERSPMHRAFVADALGGTGDLFYDRNSRAAAGAWVFDVLTRNYPGPHPRNESAATCSSQLGIRPDGYDCDEYPYASTWQSPEYSRENREYWEYDDLAYSVRYVPSSDNRTAGADLAVFYRKSRIIPNSAPWSDEFVDDIMYQRWNEFRVGVQ
ncbi:NucA/NucB deoxyribonuclease domain-containing protein [Sediminivirga luteola]|uniref:NucA/NucB deoxyribonuclease domain-containing protein n=1 Tax=Sediminivirga luteola TaxID=1774748 RepID=UPI004032CCE9